MNCPRTEKSSRSGLVLLFALFLVMEMIFASVVQSTNEFTLSGIGVWSTFIIKIIFDWFLYLVIVSVFLRTFKHRWPAVLFSSVYIFIFGLDTAVYYFSSALFEKHLLDLLALYSIKGLLVPPAILLSTVVFFLIAASGFILNKAGNMITWKKVAVWSSLLIMITIIKVSHLEIFSADPTDKAGGLARYVQQCQEDQLKYVSSNSLINFINEIVAAKTIVRYRISSDVSEFRNTIAEYDLPLGKRNYRRLGIKPFNKIILFASESLALDLISGYNKDLTAGTSVFYSSDPVRKAMFTNYRTSAIPTLQALAVMFNSHPNDELLIAGNYQNSIVRILRDEEYETVFLRSASKYFAGENVHFKKLGFDKIIAREHFEEQPYHKNYISGWGVMDRLIYDELIAILKRNRNNKIFITVLGTDTHFPNGRSSYGRLKYPPLPDGFDKYGTASKFLRSIYYHDHDVSKFLSELMTSGLLTDDTLIILTADHSPPYNKIVRSIPGYPGTPLARIPLVFITPRKLPEAGHGVLSSQLDLAPTIFHLLDIGIPEGWWGESLFSKEKKDQYIGRRRNVLQINNGEETRRIKTNDPYDQKEDCIRSLFNTIIFLEDKNRQIPSQ